MTLARTLMIQGTASNVGKTVLVAALCRFYAKQGLRVAPFKAQNMSNNAAVCPGGGEIGRAQALQAAAAGLEPRLEMNPVLLKPTAEMGAQVVVMGKPLGTRTARQYQKTKKELLPLIQRCIGQLREEHDVVVIEGAGSPAEVNLRDSDIVNMRTAELADAPVLLAGDIDCGGVFAQLIGTLHLLRPHERARVRGLLINKFRGDPSLMTPGLDFLRTETGLPVLGLLPHLRDLRLPEEDAVALDATPSRDTPGDAHDRICIEVVRHPRIANFTDLDALRCEPDVVLRFIERPSRAVPDVIVLPGTKNTIADLEHLREAGLADHIARAYSAGSEIIGICGGFQMLGERIEDPDGVESSLPSIRGLGLLPAVTTFEPRKITTRVRARDPLSACIVEGYEIHMGRTRGSGKPRFEIVSRDDDEEKEPLAYDGLCSDDGRVWGTYLHGVFDAPVFRRHFLDRLRARRGLHPLAVHTTDTLAAQLDRLAHWIESHVDLEELARILERGA